MATANAITRYRGDTVPDQVTVKNSDGTVKDITGYTFLLSVNTLRNPPDATTQLFQLTGTVAVGTDGVVTFPITSMQADQAINKFYYDVEMTDTGGKKKTILKDSYTFVQDISK